MPGITLNAIRYYKEDTPYHYTYDNQPLQDLEANDIVLKNAIESLSNNTTTVSSVGTWGNFTVSLDLYKDMNKPFAYKIRLWAVEDQSSLASQNSTFIEQVLVGYNAAPGNVSILNSTNQTTVTQGGKTLTVTYIPSGNNVLINFSGYTGTLGYVLVKAERFGI